MSAEATGWVFKNSPYKGAAFAVHLAIADSVNDQNENEFWMRQKRLAEKARVTDRAVRAAMLAMEADGYLQRLNPADELNGHPVRYQFLMPEGRNEVPGGRNQVPTRVGTQFRPGRNDVPTQQNPSRTQETEPKKKSHVPGSSELCDQLAKVLSERGVRKRTATVSDAWLDEADRLLRKDKVPFDEATQVLAWAVNDSFWHSNILSIPKFRQKYDQLKLQMRRPAREDRYANLRPVS